MIGQEHLSGKQASIADTRAGARGTDATARAVGHGVAIEAQLLATLDNMAATHGVSTETLVNLWLQERVRSAPTFDAGHHGYG